MQAALRRDGIAVGRDQVARLMRELGLAGVRRDKVHQTTVADGAATRPADLVERNFAASRPEPGVAAGLATRSSWAGL
jgi:putative transposase